MLIGDLANSIRKQTDLHFGLYHSMFDWFHPLYLDDKAAGFKTNKFTVVSVLIISYSAAAVFVKFTFDFESKPNK